MKQSVVFLFRRGLRELHGLMAAQLLNPCNSAQSAPKNGNIHFIQNHKERNSIYSKSSCRFLYVTKHINNALKEELQGFSTIAKFATVQQEGERTVTRNIEHYNIETMVKVIVNLINKNN